MYFDYALTTLLSTCMWFVCDCPGQCGFSWRWIVVCLMECLKPWVGDFRVRRWWKSRKSSLSRIEAALLRAALLQWGLYCAWMLVEGGASRDAARFWSRKVFVLWRQGGTGCFLTQIHDVRTRRSRFDLLAVTHWVAFHMRAQKHFFWYRSQEGAIAAMLQVLRMWSRVFQNFPR